MNTKQVEITFNHPKKVIGVVLIVPLLLFTTPAPVIGNSGTPEQTEVTQQKNNHTIKGIVLDDNTSEPMIGVGILVTGFNIGTTTDLDGNFQLSVPADAKTIEISYIGYEKQTIPFNPKNLNNFRVINLKESGVKLEDVTVVAFAKQRKESVLGSVSTIKPTELKVSSSNFTTGFAGKLSGVIAYQRSGEPGQDNADFFIRGVTTFGTGKANPLILIDNVELTSADLSRLNPDDIASFSILKDATATALYGARGANGVILVNTKEGKEGKVQVSFRIENSFSSPVTDTEVASPLSFMKLHNEAVRTRDPLALLPYMDSEIAARENGGNRYVYPMVDWKKMMFKDNTTNQRGNLSLSGGGKVARYYVALSYSHDNGILSVDPVNNFNNNISLNKYVVRSNVNLNLSKTTELAVRVSGTFDDYQGPITGGAGLYDMAIRSNPVLFPATFAPDKKNQYSKHVLFGNSGKFGEYMNPYAEMLRGYKESSNTVVLAQLELKQDLDFITEGLKFRVLGNATRTSYFDVKRAYKPFYYTVGSYNKLQDSYTLAALNADTGTDYLGYSQSEGERTVESTIHLEASVSYERTFAEKHAVSGMLVYTAHEGLSGNAKTLQASLPGRNLGLAGRATYGLYDRYFAEFNFGYNGSERFNKKHRWGFFPSGGLGWVVSKEAFWENIGLSKTITMFKLKGSYGLVGNDNISDDRFFYLSEVNMNDGNKSHSFGTDFTNGLNGISTSRYADEKIGWEIAHKLNLGAEVTLFNDLELQFEYFTERRSNILQTRADIPTTLGLQAIPKVNIGEAKGHGVDLSADYSHMFNKDLWVTFRGNFTFASSKFSIYEEPDYSDTPWRSHIGQKLSQEYGLIAERLFIDEEDVKSSPTQQFGEYMAGDIKYTDINGDGFVNQKDFVPIGYPTTPEIIYGFGLSAGYKGFDFSCFFQGSDRSSFWIDPGKISPFVDGIDHNATPLKGNNAVLSFIEQDHWSEANPNIYAQWPRLSTYLVGNNNQRSTWFMQNGSFLRLKTVELGYTLPKEWTSKARIQNLRLYVTGSNLLSFSKFKLWDPEMGDNGLGYPVQRVFNIGLQLGF